MSDWRTYAKAASNTARRGRDSARSSARVYTEAARRTAERQGPEVRRGMSESVARSRRTAAAYAVVAERRARRAQLGRRLANALRDALIMGASIGVIWFVITRTGVQIPVTAVLIVIAILMVVRFGYALLSPRDTTVEGQAEAPADSPEDEDPQGRDLEDVLGSQDSRPSRARQPVRSRRH